MAHSLLSVPLNLGSCTRSTRSARPRPPTAPETCRSSSAEGFVRQVLGWREYVWQLYWRFGRGYQRRNALRAHTPLPDWWRALDADAVTARCLRTALEGVRDRGWTHHIQRLMVLGNHALQRGYRPAELSDWFREAFVDGFEWVMPPNVIGMSQHADGGLLATKPYSSGGAYIAPDVRPLRRAARSTRASGSATTPARSRRATGRGRTATASCWRTTTARRVPWRAWTGWPTWTPCWSRSPPARPSDRTVSGGSLL